MATKNSFVKNFSPIVQQNIFLIILLLVGVLGLYEPPVDPDFGWHFKYGEYAVQNRQLLTANIYTYTLPDYEWINSYWLFEIILYLMHSNLGHIFSSLICATITSVVLLIFIKSFTQNNDVTAFVFVISIFLFAQFHITVRPHFFSTMFLLSLIYALDRVKTLWFLVPLFLFWANMHAEFVIGLFLFGLYCLITSLQGILDNSSDRTNLKRVLFSTTNIVFLLSLLATFVNPHGINLWLTMFKEMIQPINSLVGEWQSPFARGLEGVTQYWGYFLLMIGAIAYRAQKYNTKSVALWYRIAQIFLLLFAVKSAYMIRVAFIVALPSLIHFLDTQVKPSLEKKHLPYLGRFFVAVFSIVLVTNGMFLLRNSNDVKAWSKTYGLPFKEAQLLKKTNLSGNIFNYYGWGGYLIWQMPEHKIFIDGRMTGWKDNGSYITREYKKIKEDPEKNVALLNETFTKYQIRYVLDKKDSPLVAYLKSKGWKPMHETDFTTLLAY